MKSTLHLLVLTLALLIPGLVAAHDGPVKGPNGGPLVDTANGHWELVAKGGDLMLYVTDVSGNPVSTKPGKGTANVLVAGKTVKVDLAPLEPNILQGKGEFVAEKGMKVIISLENLGDKPETVRFTPLD